MTSGVLGRFIIGGIVSIAIVSGLSAIDKKLAYLYIFIISFVVLARYYPLFFSQLSATFNQIAGAK